MTAATVGPVADEERSPLSAVLDLLSTDEQRRTRIAWLYYVEGLTQAEIAERLAVSRVKVVRDLQIGRQTGLVQIQINGRLASCVALERALERRFGLRQAVVVPTPHDAAHLPATLGVALGSWLSDRLAPGQTLGVGWGRTLHWSVRALRRREVPGLTVVSLLGGIGRGSEINMYETASRVAETLGAQCYYLAAPAFASSQALRDMLLAQAGLDDVLERGRTGRHRHGQRRHAGAGRHQPPHRPARGGGRGRAGGARSGRRPALHLPRRRGPAGRPSAQPAARWACR